VDFKTVDDVPWELNGPEDPGIFILYGSDEAVHNCLGNAGVLPAGLVQGATPAMSTINLKNW
jgi:hypothetical protein